MKRIIKFLLVLFLLVPVQSLAFQNEPNGFRDLYWGESIEKVQKQRDIKFWMHDEASNMDMYIVHFAPDESVTLSGVPIGPQRGPFFIAGFLNNRLIKIEIGLDNEGLNFMNLKKAMDNLYGAPVIMDGKYVWFGNTTCIYLATIGKIIMVTMLGSGAIVELENQNKQQFQVGW